MGYVLTKNGSKGECPSEQKQLCVGLAALMVCLLRDLQVANPLGLVVCSFVLTKQHLFFSPLAAVFE